MQPIVITGEGIVCAIGNDENSVAESLITRQTGKLTENIIIT